jgi:acyl-CoA synthetase (AMP-forming)/AMP-acid ligase II
MAIHYSFTKYCASSSTPVWSSGGRARCDGSATSTPDGFISVGDLGWVDEEGYLFIADRRVDMINSGGANVYPAEVEAALSEHPGVGDIVVIGVPDPEWGKRVHAVVQPSDTGKIQRSALAAARESGWTGGMVHARES